MLTHLQEAQIERPGDEAGHGIPSPAYSPNLNHIRFINNDTTAKIIDPIDTHLLKVALLRISDQSVCDLNQLK